MPPNQRTMKTQVRLLSPTGRPLRLAGGRQLPCDGDLQGTDVYRIVYLPAFVAGSETALAIWLDRSGPLVEWLRVQYDQGAILAASGSSVLLLAQSGLLNHGSATVLKPLVAFSRRRYPHVHIERNSSLVEWNRIHTCSAPASEWSLVARLVERALSPHSAQWLASAIGMQSTGEGNLSSDDPLVISAQFWLSQRYAQSPNINELAKALCVSHSTLIRRFERSLGMLPREYVQQLRVSAGKHLLQSTNSRIEQIAATVGYADVRSFRSIFLARTGMSPSEYRQAHRSRDTQPLDQRSDKGSTLPLIR